MKLFINLVREVSDQTEAEQRVQHIRNLLAQDPEIKITAQTNTKIEIPEEPE